MTPAPARSAPPRAAGQLALYDHEHPELVAGPHGPYSIEWDPSHRPYVRQEYAAWTDAGHSTADGC
ncbi:hypothetical protein [Actinacidiphila oryziradicis]|uniref:hypothetical protein n=1 Tax=Actinacidiphila oryziradicis TaxID=2571141 RepID=UPI0023F0C126|nr:hypothetical protein [Actinacidiphila oryziradicis]MCW2874865.1 hypothetical protein [Actinacidiphila oryziradicis]